jgi:hypothetical protein
MRTLALAVTVLTVALPALAQTPEPPPPTPTPAPTPAPEPEPKSSVMQRLYFGGGVGLGFGTVDYVEVAPLVGFRVIPRLELGFQPFYQWTDDGRYSPSVSTTDYGARLFARVPIWRGLFAEGDYEYTNYEYPTAPGLTARDTYNAFLAGGGYYFGVGGKVGMYASALYDFSYDDNDPFRAYDSAVRYQIGVSVGF